MRPAQRVVVGITGATGAVLDAVRLLQRLRASKVEIHLVASPAGVLNVHHEMGLDRRALAGARRHGLFTRRRRRGDCQRLLHDGCDGRRALFDEVAGGDRPRAVGQPADARRRRHLEGTPASGADGPRDAVQPRPPAQHDRRDRDGRRDLPAAAGLLSPAPDDRRTGRRHRRTCAGPARRGPGGAEVLGGLPAA